MIIINVVAYLIVVFFVVGCAVFSLYWWWSWTLKSWLRRHRFIETRTNR